MLAGDELVARTSAFKKLQSVHDKFLLAYREQRWTQAKSFCKEGIDSAVSLGLHPYYETMLKRIAEYETSPPGLDWEGVYIADEK